MPGKTWPTDDGKLRMEPIFPFPGICIHFGIMPQEGHTTVPWMAPDWRRKPVSPTVCGRQ